MNNYDFLIQLDYIIVEHRRIESILMDLRKQLVILEEEDDETQGVNSRD